MTSNASRIIACFAIASSVMAASPAIAFASPLDQNCDPSAVYCPRLDEPTDTTVTVDGIDYPVCSEEDCSDQVGQIGVWFNHSGDAYLELGENVTIPVVR